MQSHLFETRWADRARRLVTAAAVGAACVLPLAVLELRRGEGVSRFPVALFLALWVLAGATALGARSVARRVSTRAGGARAMSALWPALAIVALALALWGILVLDQMPCFLGAPNCD